MPGPQPAPGTDTAAIRRVPGPGFNSGMTGWHQPPATALAPLGAVLACVDDALTDLDGQPLQRAANTGLWAAWLRWMLQLLAFEAALVWGEPGPDPGPDPGLACHAPGLSGEQCLRAQARAATGRPLSDRMLDRKIGRLIRAAAQVRAFGHPPAARRLRRRRRSLLLRWVCWIGTRSFRFCLAPLANSGLLGARVRALCQSAPEPDVSARHGTRGEAHSLARGPARRVSSPAP
jgi:hypothetical protein